MRLFLGIEISDDIKRNLSHALGPIKVSEKGWEQSHDYHMTLLFLGETREEVLDSIKNRMNEIQFSRFSIKTSKLEFFNRRVLYLGFRPSQELTLLKQKIDLLFPEWIRPENKQFIPHLTVKRWQRYEYDELVKRIKAHPIPSEEILVDGVSLFISKKDEANNKYHVIYKLKL